MVDGASLIAAYLAASIAVGAAFERKAASLRGFLVANRSIRDWVLAFTFGATYFSSVVMVVGASWAYAWGPKALIIPLANIAVGVLVAFALVGVRVNRLSRVTDALTVPELLGKLHGDNGVRRLVGLATGLGLLLYLATVISGASVVAAKALGLDVWQAAVIVGGIIALYVALSGMYGVVWTDVLQGIIMVSFIAALLVKALTVTGVVPLDKVAPLRDASMLVIVDLSMLTSLAVLGLPQMVNRFYTVPSVRAVRRATGIAAAFAYVVALGSFLAGLAARILSPGAKPIDAMPSLAAALFGSTGVGLLAAAVLAASMSTADSVALTAASSLVYDAMGSRSTRAMRVSSAVIVLAAVATAVALLSVHGELYKAVTAVFKAGWSIAAGATLVPLLAALAGKADAKAAKASAVAGIVLPLAFTAAKIAQTLGATLPAALQPLLQLSFTLTIAVSAVVYAVATLASARNNTARAMSAR